jgi:hypothetical protein
MKFFYTFCLLFACSFVYSQNFEYKKYIYEWPNKKPDVSQATNVFSNEDIVVIDEKIKLNIIDRFAQTLTKNCIVKINNANGIKKVSKVAFPESFDIAADKHLSKQGRDSKIVVPYIYKFKIIYYAARILKPNGEVIDVPMESKVEKFNWIDNDGTHLEDYIYQFINEGLEAGDFLEYSYQTEFRGRYGYNLFYFHNEIPKQNCNFEVRYSPILAFEDYAIINSSNGADSALTITSIYNENKSKKTWIYTYRFKNLPSINYPVNTNCGKELPHIFADLNFLSYYGISNVPTQALIYAERGSEFEWLFANKNDSLGYQKSVYDQQHAAVRKFLTKIPPNANDEVYYRLLCDSLNAQKFVTAESMRYNENAQYSLSSGELLMRRKIIEQYLYELYWELLNEKKRTTYFVTIQDKRLGEINFNKHGEYKYERVVYGVPDGKKVKFIVPRYSGLKYNVDELPFYLEGVNAAVLGVNYKIFDLTQYTTATDFHHLSKVLYFVKTPGSSENENVRTENGSFKVNMDSVLIHANIRENLNGQFSTVIRPLYLNDAIDSTVHPVYFKKCTDKPNAQKIKITSTSKSDIFPFKHSFNCTEDIILKQNMEIPLTNWFSFTFSKNDINQLPNFDYYLDFKYSDMYNYLFQFNKPVSITNAGDFTKSINNKYFELTSNLVRQDDSSYLLSLAVKVKQETLPKEDGQLLLDFVNELDALNNGILKLK